MYHAANNLGLAAIPADAGFLCDKEGLMFRSKVFYKYVLSYLVLLVFVFVVLNFVFANAVTSLRNNVATSVRNQFTQGSQELEKEMSSLKNTADLMYTNIELTKYNLANGGYKTILGIDELRKIRASNSFIYDVFINYRDGSIYSSFGKIATDVYALSTLQLKDDSRGLIQTALANPESTGYNALYAADAATVQPKYMLCTFPLVTNGSIIGTVGFIISSTRIENILQNMLHDFDSGVRMVLPSGETFLQLNKGDTAISFNEAANARAASYTYYSYQSVLTGSIFEIALRTDAMYAGILQIRSISYLIMAAIFIISCLFAYLFSRTHYRPIFALSKTAGQYTPAGLATIGQHKNEFEVIHHLIDYEATENLRLTQELFAINPTFRLQTSALLFSGIFKDARLLARIMQMGQTDLKEPYFTVMSISLEYDGDIQVKHPGGMDLALLLQKAYGLSYASTLMGKEILAVLIPLQTRDTSFKQRKKAAADIQSLLADYAYEARLVCFGQVYTGLDLISDSYSEAMACTEQYLLKSSPETPVFFEKAMTVGSQSFSFDEKDIANLTRHLIRKDLKAAQECFDDIFASLHRQQMSIATLRFHYYHLRHELFRQLGDAGAPGFQLADLMKIDCSSTENFSYQMKKFFRQICEKKASQSTPGDIIDEALAFIRKNYKNPNLTLSLLAQEFHLSPSYLSSYFKERVGVNYIQFLSELRLKEAHRLLLETDRSIQDITVDVGYLDAVNFTKKFKKIYEVTPSELRIKGAN